MKKILFSLSIFCAFIACSGIKIDTVNPSGTVKPVTPDPDAFVAEVEAPHIFKAKNNGYHTFRIPAITKTKDGTLIAFCEGRKNSGSDTGDIDLICRRSIDGGKTWSKIITVWDDAKNTCGNPSPVVDMETGRIHLCMTWNYETDGASAGDFNKEGVTKDTRRVYYTYSDDDGKTWQEAKEITASTKLSNWGWYATGPCHGIILQKGAHKGRILIPCDHNEKGGSGYSHVIYSDDKGKTWHIGGRIKGGNESCAEELEDGTIFITCRKADNRLLSWSTDGGITFSAGEAYPTLPDPKCQASCVGTTFNGKNVLLHCNCAASSRIMLTIKASLDGGKKWTGGHTLWEGPTAYSDMVMLDDSNIGVLYENGDSKSYERISFKTVKVANCL